MNPGDIEAIAARVVELLRVAPVAPVDSDPWLTRVQAARYLAMSARSFARAREEEGEALRTASQHPLRWAKSTLDTFKLLRGANAPRRIRSYKKAA